MKIGIIGAMEEEVRLLSAALEEKKEWQEAGATFYSGKLHNQEVVIVLSGIGKVLAAVTATLLISQYKVDVVLNTGSAGGIGPDLAIGDLVVSEKLAYYDADVTAFGYEMGQMAGMPLYYEADSQLIEAIEQAAVKTNLAVRKGLIVSGDSFVSSADKIAEIQAIFPDVLANEMEGAAIAQVAFRYQVPFVVIRAMSDVGDENAAVNFDEFILTAGKRSAAMVEAFLQEYRK